MKENHSPLPWTLDKNGIFDSNENCIDVSEDNYSFIVSCVNTHAQLIDALESSIKSMMQVAALADDLPPLVINQVNDSIEKSVAALALASGTTEEGK